MYWTLIVIAGMFNPSHPPVGINFRTQRECQVAQKLVNEYYLNSENFTNARAPFTACVKSKTIVLFLTTL